MKSKSALGIFFRIPEFGKVKRRLANEIGEDDTLNAYKSMLKETIENVLRLKGIDIYGFYVGRKDSFEKAGNLEFLKRNSLIPQKGNNLGERMYNAIQLLFDAGYQKVSLIGSDSPDIPISYIEIAFQKLDYYEIVIGPSEDGGYYLIGMRKPHEEIFKNTVWGRDTVLKDTISNVVNAGLSYFLLPEWYDIDDFVSLNRWRSNRRQVEQF